MQSTRPQRQFAVEVVTRLRAAGFDAYWAGGCVRDALLGLEPKDYDVATSAPPDEIRRIFGRRKTLAIGASFGVITVLGNKQQGQIEVATFRQDAAYSDGRHPDSVRFSTAREDAQRRDFTINGLFFDPVADQVIDFVGGEDDLRRGIVRAIGDPDARIDEDKLRMLRAVRFASTFDFQVDHQTLRAVRRHAEEILLVSAERIAEEMRRMLVHDRRARAVRLLNLAGLLDVVLPEAQALAPPPWDDACDDVPDDAHAGPPWQHALAILEQLPEPSFSMALAALLREAGDPATPRQAVVQEVARRWRLSNDVKDRAAWLLEKEPVVRRASEARWPDLQRILVAAAAAELLDYAEAVARVIDGHTGEIDFCRAKLALPADRLNPPPLITGDDLKAAGIPPGKAYRGLLTAARDAQLEGRITTKDEALRLARRLLESS